MPRVLSLSVEQLWPKREEAGHRGGPDPLCPLPSPPPACATAAPPRSRPPHKGRSFTAAASRAPRARARGRARGVGRGGRRTGSARAPRAPRARARPSVGRSATRTPCELCSVVKWKSKATMAIAGAIARCTGRKARWAPRSRRARGPEAGKIHDCPFPPPGTPIRLPKGAVRPAVEAAEGLHRPAIRRTGSSPRPGRWSPARGYSTAGGGSRLPRSLDYGSNGPPPLGEQNPERNEPQERASLGRAWDVVNGGPLCVCLPLTRWRGGEARGPGKKMTGNALCGLSPAPPLPRSARLIASSVPSLQEKKPGPRRGAAVRQIVCHARRGATKAPAGCSAATGLDEFDPVARRALALRRALPQGDLAERPLSARHGGRRRGGGCAWTRARVAWGFWRFE